MNEFTKFEVGQRFPLPDYDIKQEFGVAIITDSFTDLLLSLGNPTQEEVNEIGAGNLIVSVFVHDDVPFITIRTAHLLFPCAINVHALIEPEKWLNGDGNIVVLYLVDSQTYTLKIIRTLGLKMELVDFTREALTRQLANTTTEQVAQVISTVMSSMKDEDIFEVSQFRHKF